MFLVKWGLTRTVALVKREASAPHGPVRIGMGNNTTRLFRKRAPFNHSHGSQRRGHADCPSKGHDRTATPYQQQRHQRCIIHNAPFPSPSSTISTRPGMGGGRPLSPSARTLRPISKDCGTHHDWQMGERGRMTSDPLTFYPSYPLPFMYLTLSLSLGL